MNDTELGIVIEVKLVQCEKDSFPIRFTELGMLTEIKVVQSLKSAVSDTQYKIYISINSKCF